MKTDLFKLQDIFSEDLFSLRGTGCFSGQLHCLNVTFRLSVIAHSISTQHHIYTKLQYIRILKSYIIIDGTAPHKIRMNGTAHFISYRYASYTRSLFLYKLFAFSDILVKTCLILAFFVYKLCAISNWAYNAT